MASEDGSYSPGQRSSNSQYNERENISSHIGSEDDFQEDAQTKRHYKSRHFYPDACASVGYETRAINTVNKIFGSTKRPIFIRSVIKMADKCTQAPEKRSDTLAGDPFFDCEEGMEQMMGASAGNADLEFNTDPELSALEETVGDKTKTVLSQSLPPMIFEQITRSENVNTFEAIETIDLTRNLDTDSEDTPSESNAKEIRPNSEKGIHSQKTLFDYGISIIKVKSEYVEPSSEDSESTLVNSTEVTVLHNEPPSSKLLMKNGNENIYDSPSTNSETQSLENYNITWEFLKSYWSTYNTIYKVMCARNANVNPLSLESLVTFSKRRFGYPDHIKCTDQNHKASAFNALIRLKMQGVINMCSTQENIVNITLTQYSEKIFDQLVSEKNNVQ